MSNIYLILTVGTGTAGKHSSLVDGLRKTIKLISPAGFWLIPSESEDSIATADLVRDGFDAFIPWDQKSTYLHITQHDSLQNCRENVRTVIKRVKQQLKKNDRLIVNPTSGTKQMSAGATVAALDENIGELVFTIGDRADGVVKTGTERLETFQARNYFAERDFLLAQELYRSGSFLNAAQVLKQYPQRYAGHIDLCECIHHWENLNYAKALDIAKNAQLEIFKNFLNHLRPLDKESKQNTPRIAADLLKSATRLYSRKDYSSALFRACKSFEVAVRAELLKQCNLSEPYKKSELLEINLPKEICNKINNSHHKTIHLGLAEIASILMQYGSPIGNDYKTKDIKDAINLRHELAHSIRDVSQKESRLAIDAIQKSITHLNPPTPVNLPAKLAIPL